MELAKNEYDDFPVVQEEIIFAANDVKQGADELSDATVSLEKKV